MKTPAEAVKALVRLKLRNWDWGDPLYAGKRVNRAQRLYLHWWRSALLAEVALAKSRERGLLHTRDAARELVRTIRGSAQIDVVLERVERAVREWDATEKGREG